jgi:hypothetical protein
MFTEYKCTAMCEKNTSKERKYFIQILLKFINISWIYKIQKEQKPGKTAESKDPSEKTGQYFIIATDCDIIT